MTAGRGFHRPRGPDLRQLATVRRRGCLPPVRLLERPRRLPPGIFDVDLDAVRRASVRPHPRRSRRCDRPLDPARLGRTTVRQAVSAVARANGLPRARNRRACASLVVGVLAVGVCPIAIASSEIFDEITLVQSCVSAIVAAVLGLVAIGLARRGTRDRPADTRPERGRRGCAHRQGARRDRALDRRDDRACRRLLLAADALRRLSRRTIPQPHVRDRVEPTRSTSPQRARDPRCRACDDDPRQVPARARGRELRRAPEPGVRHGFLRSYADFLGLDGRLFVDEYTSRFWVDEEQGSRRARRIRIREQHHRRAERNMVVFTVIAHRRRDGARDRRVELRGRKREPEDSRTSRRPPRSGRLRPPLER